MTKVPLSNSRQNACCIFAADVYYINEGQGKTKTNRHRSKRQVTFMASLADLIEAYIQRLVEAGEGVAEIQRALLAERFRCAPSQISYVISSRFSPERGYIIESRRGGGGYIRLIKVELDDEDLQEMINDIGSHLSQSEAYDYLERLYNEGFMDEKTYQVMKAATSRKSLALVLPDRDMIRANVFKAMLNAYFATNPRSEEP